MCLMLVSALGSMLEGSIRCLANGTAGHFARSLLEMQARQSHCERQGLGISDIAGRCITSGADLIRNGRSTSLADQILEGFEVAPAGYANCTIIVFVPLVSDLLRYHIVQGSSKKSLPERANAFTDIALPSWRGRESAVASLDLEPVAKMPTGTASLVDLPGEVIVRIAAKLEVSQEIKQLRASCALAKAALGREGWKLLIAHCSEV